MFYIIHVIISSNPNLAVQTAAQAFAALTADAGSATLTPAVSTQIKSVIGALNSIYGKE
jgi:hypothetical protein